MLLTVWGSTYLFIFSVTSRLWRRDLYLPWEAVYIAPSKLAPTKKNTHTRKSTTQWASVGRGDAFHLKVEEHYFVSSGFLTWWAIYYINSKQTNWCWRGDGGDGSAMIPDQYSHLPPRYNKKQCINVVMNEMPTSLDLVRVSPKKCHFYRWRRNDTECLVGEYIGPSTHQLRCIQIVRRSRQYSQ